ncbi:MAG: ABC-type transporter Mla subunit MlaD [Natronomonas sp.]|jgi:vacuolar-type H+-ATPase subunit E/Vma4|uniref:DUF7553 family protein n=1 Tax=Natronomonas sp. TaxID=2184060 RepID=UPI0039E3795B
MSADELQAALDELQAARDLADGEAAERLETIIGRVEKAIDAGRTMDHGVLARMLRTISEIQEDADADLEAALESASEAITTYREGVPGA